MMKRRQLLKVLGAGACAAAGAWPLLRPTAARATTASRPRFYLQIIPQGGMDAIYTTDPKLAREVESGIDAPLAASDIVEGKNYRLGPPFKSLERWMSRLAVVNAFRQNSANHQSGLAHVMRCKSGALPRTPSLLEILGARRDGEATAAFNIGSVYGSAFSPAFLGEPSTFVFGKRPGLFAHLDTADPEELRDLAEAMRREAQTLRGPRATDAERLAADNILQSAALFGRVADAPKFAPTAWPFELEDTYKNGEDLQRALWLFEHGLTRCVTVCVGMQDFDTHLSNSDQVPMTSYLAGLLDRLFTELDARVVGGKPLSEQTVVMVGSEIGRFPRLNAAKGKDHFPQVPHLFYGPWFAGGASYGSTDARMAAVPISLSNGRPQTGGHLLRVDDIGTTLLALDGANPELFGYTGERMDFLVR